MAASHVAAALAALDSARVDTLVANRRDSTHDTRKAHFDLRHAPYTIRAVTHPRIAFTPLVLGGGRAFTANGSGAWALFVGAGLRLSN